jgi:hypothetical protein
MNINQLNQELNKFKTVYDFKKGDSVFFKCNNPATGFIKRVLPKIKKVDVLWNASLGCSYVSRVKMEDIVHLNPVLNAINEKAEDYKYTITYVDNDGKEFVKQEPKFTKEKEITVNIPEGMKLCDRNGKEIK